MKQLLLEADGFYASGRFDLAFKRYEQVLNIDKYNIAARRGMERVNVARQKYATSAYNEARGDMLRQVDKGWELPVRRFEVGASTIIEQPQIDTRGTSLINRKLDEIVIPRIDFRDATIREALDFIKQRAVALDTTEQDPSRRGINIVLKAPADSPEANSRITLSLNDIPLRAAIDYVAKAANLKLKIEPYAVAVVPQSEPTDILITKEYKVPPGFITSLPAGQPTNLPGPGSQTVAPGSQPAIQARSGAREFLEAQGVTFPQGASANFIASTSKLIVKNTQANLDLIDTLVETQMTAPPSQVEIESKFLEVTQTNLKEMGFDWLLGQFALPFGTGIYGGGGTQGLGQSIDASSFPFLNQDQQASQLAPQAALRVRSQPAIVRVPPRSPRTRSTACFSAPRGCRTRPSFRRRDLYQSSVSSRSPCAEPAKRRRSRERPEGHHQERPAGNHTDHPGIPLSDRVPICLKSLRLRDPFTPRQLRQLRLRSKQNPLALHSKSSRRSGPTATPSTSFSRLVSSNLMALSTMEAPSTLLSPPSALVLSANFRVTDNVINKPVFSTREVTTEVTVYDGQTVVIGGLMREDIQKTEDKVPILGDIPLAGRLFRTTADQHIKTKPNHVRHREFAGPRRPAADQGR